MRRWQIEVRRCPRCHSCSLVVRPMDSVPMLYCEQCHSAWPLVGYDEGPGGCLPTSPAVGSASGIMVRAMTPALREFQENGYLIVVRSEDGRLEVVV